ncbi:MAG: TRAP transporter substrate-binding protein [Myxococcales bacterium]|nr:TRAP transporter substrate-binding protein [Myxococcales bacterium]
MDNYRNRWLWGLIFLVGVVGVNCTGSSPQGSGNEGASPSKIYRWKMVTTWPKNFPGLGMAPVHFAEAVRAMSGGRLLVKVYGAGELVPALGVFDAVSQGMTQMGHGASYYWKGKVPEAQFFCAVPFGLSPREMSGWLRFGGGMQLWKELYKPYGLVPFMGGNTGVQMGGWFNKEITSLEDIKGLKVRMPGLGGEVLERVGGVPVLIAGGEIFTSLQTGVIDAAEWVGPYNDLTFGFHKVAKIYHYPGWQEPGPILEFIVNEKALQTLPQDLRAVVQYAADAVHQIMLDEYAARDPAALEELIDTHNIKIVPYPEEVLAALKKESEVVLKSLSERSPMAKRIYDSYFAFKKRSERHTRITEGAFLDAR